MEGPKEINEHIRQLINTIQTTENSEERKRLVYQILEQFKPFRRSLASRFFQKGVDFDDIIQQIDLKLIEAIYDYDPNKDPYPIRHITSRANNGIWNYYRKEMHYFNKDKQTISIDGFNGYDSCDSMFESGMSYRHDEDQIIEKILIEDELNKLTDHQKEVILMFYVDDKNQYDIAKQLQINQSNVSRAKKRGVKRIQDSINPSDESPSNS